MVLELKTMEDENNFFGMLQDHDDGMAEQVNIDRFLGRIEREINKYVQIQRFYLYCDKLKDAEQEVTDYLVTKGLDLASSEMKTEDLKNLLVEMELVGFKDENWDYFKEDFDPDGMGVVASDKFEEDIKEIYP